jgi:DNA-binding MarR family transcriptional regulator
MEAALPVSAARRAPDAGRASAPPLSVTRPALLVGGSDRAFRDLIWSLLIVANRLPRYPEAFGRYLGISGAMYTVLIAAAHTQGPGGVGIRALADYMHLPAPHITTTVGKLVDEGFLAKRPNPKDGRGVLISLTAAGAAALARLAPFQSEVNNVLFDGIGHEDFHALARLMETMVGNSARALARVEALDRARRAGKGE